MHRCLKIAEITELICEQGFHDEDYDCRKGIMALARTCRSIYEPAANVIWRRIPTLTPLLATVSNEIWNGVRDDRADNPKPLRPRDLRRFKELAKRVRAFGPDEEAFNKSKPPSGSPDLCQYKALYLAAGHATLLPNIVEVSLVDPDSTTLGYVNLFTNPRIKIFRMSMGRNARHKPDLLHVSGFLSALEDRYPELESLDIQGITSEIGEPIPATFEGIASSCQWERLSTIALGGSISALMVLNVFQRPCLRSIDIRSPDLDVRLPAMERGAGLAQVLPLVESITLYVFDLSVLLDFLHLLTPGKRAIRCAHLWAASPEKSSLDQWIKALECLYTGCQPSLLETLSLDDKPISEDQDVLEYLNRERRYILTFDDLKRLFDFKSLTDVRIVTFGVLAIDDGVLAQIVLCWPQIRKLTLRGQHPLNLPPKVTPLGLTLFSDKCPELALLAIEFNPDPSPISNPGGRPRFGHRLERLDVMRSPIVKPGPIAAFIADVFPGVEDIAWEHESGEELDKSWKLVEELVPIFVKARSDEAARLERAGVMTAIR